MITLQIPLAEKRSGRTKLACAMTSLAVVLTIGFAAMATPAPASAQEKKPNVVMLMTDDTGWGDFGAYAGGGKALGPPTLIASPRKV